MAFMPSIDLSADFFISQKLPYPIPYLPPSSSVDDLDSDTTDAFECKVVNNKQPEVPLVGIISKIGPKGTKKGRKDFYGNEIGGDQKIHKVTFRDIIPQKALEDVEYIESYKDFNGLNDLKGSTSKAGCTCCIF